MISKKWVGRMFQSGQSVALGILTPFFMIILSFWVSKYVGEGLWGEYVSLVIVPFLLVAIANWGSNEYLQRQFAIEPSKIISLWLGVFIQRTLLLAILLFAYGLFFNVEYLWLLIGFSLSHHAYQSLTPIIRHNRQFIPAVVVELVSISSLLFWLLMKYNIGIEVILKGLVIINLFKFSALLIKLLGKNSSKVTIRLDWRYWLNAFPFFMLAISGMLASKVDLYLVDYFLSVVELGSYQIMVTFALFIQSVSALILLPFVKNMYRIDATTSLKITSISLAIGLLIVVFGFPVLWIIGNEIYGFKLESAFYVLLTLSCLPSYGYVPLIHQLFKEHKEFNVVVINLCVMVTNLLLSYLLIPEIGVLGALYGTLFSQLVMLIGVYWSVHLLQTGKRK